jgi:hypothetical protein
MDIVYIDKRRYDIQEQKEVPVWYTGIHRSISSYNIFLQINMPENYQSLNSNLTTKY